MRYDTIDFLKGIAIILMIIFHIFYFPNVYGYTEFKWNTPLLKIILKDSTGNLYYYSRYKFIL